MKVGWISNRSWDDPTGIGTYARRLISAQMLTSVEGELIGRPQNFPDSPLPPFHAMNLSGGRLVERFLAARRLRSRAYDLLHFLSLHEIYYGDTRRQPAVATVHGFGSLHLSARLHEPMRPWEMEKYRLLLGRMNRIIAVSNATKQDLTERFKLSSERITVVHHGVDACFKPPGSPANARGSGPAESPFILCVGSTTPKKNLLRVLRATALLKRRGRSFRLIHAGPPGWGHEEILSEVTRLGLDEIVEFKGRLPKPELVELYQQARLLCFPSLHEGFGMPILEAMASGCPVITSNLFSMPEVAGGAALLVDPDRHEEIAVAMERLLTDDGMRNAMIRAGFNRAASFSWDRCARETIEAYRSAGVRT